MLEFLALAQECAPTVSPQTMAALVHVESSYNPYAIGVVGGRLQRQPKTLEEAVATAEQLAANGWNFSMGIAQVNRYNLPKYKLSYAQAFEPCANLRAGSKILEECYARAAVKMPGKEQNALQAAFSCYYSGNFTRGFKPDKAGSPSYVQKVLASANVMPKAIPVVPAIKQGAPQAKPAAKPAAVPAAAPAKLTAEVPEGPQVVIRAASVGTPADHASVGIDLTQQFAAPAAVAAAKAPPPAAVQEVVDPAAPVTLRAASSAGSVSSAESASGDSLTVF